MATATKAEGIALVIKNHPDQYRELRAFSELWIKSHSGEFTFEDIKIDYLKHYPEVPPNLNGSVMARLAESGIITYLRHQKSKLPKARSRMLGVWMAKGQIPMFS